MVGKAFPARLALRDPAPHLLARRRHAMGQLMLPAIELAHAQQVGAQADVARMARVGDVAIGLHRADQLGHAGDHCPPPPWRRRGFQAAMPLTISENGSASMSPMLLARQAHQATHVGRQRLRIEHLTSCRASPPHWIFITMAWGRMRWVSVMPSANADFRRSSSASLAHSSCAADWEQAKVSRSAIWWLSSPARTPHGAPARRARTRKAGG
jgi:hypothetical protein